MDSTPNPLRGLVTLALVVSCNLIGAPAAADPIGDATGALPGDVSGTGAAVGQTIGDTTGTVGDAVGDAAGAAGDAVGGATGSVGDAVGGPVGDAVGDAGGSVGDAIGGSGGEAGGTVGDVGGSVGGAIGGATGGGGEDVVDPPDPGGVVDEVDRTLEGAAGNSAPGGGLGHGFDAGGSAPSGTTVGGSIEVPGTPDLSEVLDPAQAAIGKAPNGSDRGTTGGTDGGLAPELGGAPDVALDGFVGSARSLEAASVTDPSHAGDSFFQRAVAAAIRATRKLIFPALLLALMAGFLLIHNRYGRKDPKLAVAPMDPDQEFVTFG